MRVIHGDLPAATAILDDMGAEPDLLPDDSWEEAVSQWDALTVAALNERSGALVDMIESYYPGIDRVSATEGAREIAFEELRPAAD